MPRPCNYPPQGFYFLKKSYICGMRRAYCIYRGARLLLVALLLACAGAVHLQAQTCEGRVCLKGGSRLLYTGDDRMEVPSKKRDLQVYRRFFSRECQKDKVPIGRIDSVVVWNSATPGSVRLLVPLEGVGWSWLYAACSRMEVYVYASQGYSLNAHGGIRAWQGNRVSALFLIPGKTACDFYVVGTDGKPVCLGDAYKKCDKSVVRKLCRCAGLSAQQEQSLLKEGETNRSDVILRVLELIDGDKPNHNKKRYNENNPALAAAPGSRAPWPGGPGAQE